MPQAMSPQKFEWMSAAVRVKFERMSAAVLTYLGATRDVIEHRGATYRWRRFLPSGAEAVEMASPRQQSIGNWQEIPKGQDKVKSRASFPMHRRYAEGVMDFSAESKGIVLVAANHIQDKVKSQWLIRSMDFESFVRSVAMRSNCGQSGILTPGARWRSHRGQEHAR